MFLTINITPPAPPTDVDLVAPTISDAIIIPPSTVTWLVDTNGGTLSWAISASATPLTTGQIDSGVGLPFGTLPITGGTASGAINLSAASTGTYYFHAYATNAAGTSGVNVSEAFYLENG